MAVLNSILQIESSSFFIMQRALQIIVLLPLLGANLPPNAGKVFKYLTDMAAFDYIEIGDFVDRILSLLPTEPINFEMETLGFSTR